MKKAVFLTTLGCWGVSTFFPWWMICVATAIAGMMCSNQLRALGLGFCSAFLLWSGWPIIVHFSGHGVLAPRIASVFQLPWWPLILLIPGVIGGALGLVGSWLGFASKRLLFESGRGRRAT